MARCFRPHHLVALALAGAGCAGDPALNRVQDGAKSDASWFVSVSAAEGFAPECKTIDAGDTVEWENLDPGVPANVTSLDEPPEHCDWAGRASSTRP